MQTGQKICGRRIAGGNTLVAPYDFKACFFLVDFLGDLFLKTMRSPLSDFPLCFLLFPFISRNRDFSMGYGQKNKKIRRRAGLARRGCGWKVSNSRGLPCLGCLPGGSIPTIGIVIAIISDFVNLLSGSYSVWRRFWLFALVTSWPALSRPSTLRRRHFV